MSGHITRRNSVPHKRPPSLSKKLENGSLSEPPSKASSPPPQEFDGGERTVKKLRLSKALTISEVTTVSEACRRMAARRVDAVLLTDSNVLLSGIMTDKDIATRVIAEGLRPEQTMVSKVMTRSPIFVTSDTLALEALQKMVQGKFRHLPVVENGEVIAILDITRCLYDAITRMEKAAEQGSAIAAAVEGVERHRGSNVSASALIEALRERMFKPSLSTLMGENTKVAIASPADPVYVAARKMRDLRVNSAVIVSLSGTKIQGILTSKDILMRVVAQNLSPELTLVEKVMTPNPDCASVDTTILDSLHMMHDGKFLHLPVVDKDGYVVACMDVLQITHAAISMVESSSGAVNDVANTIMQKFWDSAFNLEPPEDSDTHSEISGLMTSDGADTSKSAYQSVGFGNSFAFKFKDLSGRVHRFNCGTEHIDELVSTIMQRLDVNDVERPMILYEDDEGDKIVLATDSDLVSAVSYATSAGMKALKLHLDFGSSTKATTPKSCTATRQKTSALSMRSSIFASAIVITSIGMLVYLKRSKQ
ncbi:hypothetical protein GLYMA_05G195700v4 [Glycine max]|uniref:CBS domain-containing protein n=2 Tax=Glycine subgen. Soja TaxID=1462606 RepID=I1K529_SOYBN|nr:CBS domain-containing protein CBSCBSPB3 [Glycine max]XP_028233349.1 CBS domain-containing protein CBSCBSPB3-like [Glycine soja]KAH1135298.1 hypothetical protein GYH30_013191 [Glycine max]KRH59636.1 hypothetical protein GLYMA_05G195700v4 [Glycine max]RZC13252.1 CBS domain-containing protein CBSCBSPB3 [Glycine soja]|eukprot:XP_003525140.1 CBS domain-containing protein CBSCBSPB3-like [Glycine max]